MEWLRGKLNQKKGSTTKPKEKVRTTLNGSHHRHRSKFRTINPNVLSKWRWWNVERETSGWVKAAKGRSLKSENRTRSG